MSKQMMFFLLKTRKNPNNPLFPYVATPFLPYVQKRMVLKKKQKNPNNPFFPYVATPLLPYVQKKNAVFALFLLFFVIACIKLEIFTFGGGGGISPQRIWSCFSFSAASRRCVRSFLRSRLVSGSGCGAGGAGSAGGSVHKKA